MSHEVLRVFANVISIFPLDKISTLMKKVKEGLEPTEFNNMVMTGDSSCHKRS
jgi:hypothetical protein